MRATIELALLAMSVELAETPEELELIRRRIDHWYQCQKPETVMEPLKVQKLTELSDLYFQRKNELSTALHTHI